MSWLDRFLGPRKREQTSDCTNEGRGPYTLAVVGETQYQGALIAILQMLLPDADGQFVIPVWLHCEPKNYDSVAVRVSSMRGNTLGHLSRADAARYCDPIQNAGGSVTCDALLRLAGEGEPNIRAWLDLAEPDDIGEARA